MSEDTPAAQAAPAEPHNAIRSPLVQFRKRSYEVHLTKYVENENTCIALLDPRNGQLALKATVNLHTLAPHLVYIKDYSENRGILDALLAAKLISRTGHSRRNGAEEFQLCQLTSRLAGPWGIELPPAEPEGEPASTQESALDAPPSNGVPKAVAPSDDDVGEAKADWGSFESQQAMNRVEAAKAAAAERDPDGSSVSDDAATDPADT